MDLGQNYTQFVDDIESGEFDNFLSKSKRQELKRKKDRIKELRRGGMRMRDAIIQASEEAMDRRRGDREENRIVGLSSIVESKPARLKMNRPINKKYKLKGKAIRVAENDVDEDVVVKDAIKVSRPMELEEGALETSVDTTPKEEGFVQKYKTLLMIGGGLAVAFVLFKKFGKNLAKNK